jgi:ATP-dependent helicase/nuclease subunit A
MKVQFTQDQQRAIDQTGNLIVSASAGSGKTTVMISRILRLLQQGIDINGLVVSTFTRASAQDMQTKLKNKLDELAAQDPNSIGLVDKVNEMNIGTFHSLCAKFVRQYFYAAQVDPDFVLMDEIESGTLLQESIVQVIEEAHLNPTADFLDLYNIMLSNRTDRALRQQIATVYLYCKAQVDWQQWLDTAVDNHSDPDRIVQLYQDTINARREQLKLQLLAFCQECIKIGMDCGVYVNELTQLLEGKEIKLSVLSQKKCSVDKDNWAHLDKYEQFKALKNYIKDSCDKLNLELMDPKLAYPIAKELLTLCNKSCIVYEQRKSNISKLDFGDIEHCMLKVLHNTQARQQLTSSISHIFVDEYQDINPLQDMIIGMLSERAEIFVVGDVKQSIYSFRMCNPKFFVHKMQLDSLHNLNMRLIKLNGNFRSDNKILDFVNAVFAPIMTAQYGGSDYAQDSMLTGRVAIDPNPNSPKAVLCKVVHCTKPERPDKLPIYDIRNHVNDMYDGAAECDVVVRHIADLVLNHGVQLEDISILTQSRDKFAYALCDALNEVGFDTKLGQSKSVLESIETSSIISYLALVDYPRDDINLATVLRSGFVGLDDNQLSNIRLNHKDGATFYDCCRTYATSHNDDVGKMLQVLFDKLEYYSVLKHSLTVSQLAHTIIAEHDFELSLYGNKDANPEVLYWFLQDIEKHPYQYDLYKFLQSIQDTQPNIRESESKNCISIITVHASKGLEYDYIILPNLDRTFNKDYSRLKFLLNSDMGLASKNFDVLNGRVGTNAVFEYFKLNIDANARAEEMRLLYVALTRAKKQLLMTMDSRASDCNEGDSVNKWSDWIWPIVQQLEIVNNCYYDDGWVRFDPNSQQDVDTSLGDTNDTLQRQLSQVQAPLVFGKPDSQLLKLVEDSMTPQWQSNNRVAKSSVTRLLKTEEFEPVLYDNDMLDVGTGYHKVLQHIDYAQDWETAWSNVSGIVEELRSQGVDINMDIVHKTHNIFGKMTQGATVYKERAFVLNALNFDVDDGGKLVKAAEYYNTALIQGIIDIVILKDNHVTIVDYKYKMHKSSQDAYNKQLQLYTHAINKILGLTVERACVYDICKTQLYDMKDIIQS